MKPLTASLAAAIVAAGALSANAALIEFRYQGQEFYNPYLPDRLPFWNPISASVFIDSDLYPLSSVAGSTIWLGYDVYDSGYGMLDYVEIDASKDNQHYTAEVHGKSLWDSAGPSAAQLYGNDPGFRFIEVTGDILIGYAVSSMPQGIFLSIGQDLTVLSGRSELTRLCGQRGFP